MFKVPDWGNDIPKSDVEMIKLFTAKKKTKGSKTNAPSNIKNNVKNKEPNHKKKKFNAIKKAKNNINGHVKLTKEDHINSRILKRNLKITSAQTPKNRTENTTGGPMLKDGNMHNGANVSMKAQNNILKRKIPKIVSNTEISGTKAPNNINKKQKKVNSKETNNIINKTLSQKRKLVLNNKGNDDVKMDNADIQNLDTDEPDKELVTAKRKKLNDKIKNDDVENVLFGNENSNEEKLTKKNIPTLHKDNKERKKKEILRKILLRDSNRNIIKASSNKLRERMLERLKAAQFRYLNEKLYTSSGTESQELFKSDPAAFQTYHEGYQLQVKKWPVNPLDLIVKRIQKMPKTHLIADMGCGEAALSKRVPQSVRSFDLVATTPGVEACNMAHTPLLAASMDVVVFCLALMGTDLTQYLLEANRVLKIGGHLLIAEVESRFENVDSFSSEVQRLGFSLKKVDKSHQVFFFMEFNKVRDAPAKKNKLPTLSLKPCLYKRR